MPTNDPTLPSQKAVARHFKVDPKAVRKWAAHDDWPGVPSKASVIQTWYDQRIAPHHNSKTSIEEKKLPTADPFLRIEREAKADVAQARARKYRLEAEIAEGEQTPTVLFERAISALVTEYRRRRMDQCEAWPVILEGKSEHQIRQFMRDQMDKEDAHWQEQQRIQLKGASTSASLPGTNRRKSRAQSRRHARS